jgi:ACS family 4-hydroxyphenylacetate permease-like MFS transporter
MDVTAQTNSEFVVAADEAVIRRCFRRLIWFLFVLYIMASLDRNNIAFAALTMNKELGLNATAFALAGTVFSVGYFLFEIPSNLMMARYGARIWIARIMVTWGIATTLTMFATGAYSLYGFRLLVGIAEAGFVPGVLLYLTYWFPRDYRARAISILVVSQPLTLALASAVSGLILELNGTFGLSGWRWLFLLEGLPAVLLGIISYFYLTDRPSEARWLTEGEKSVLQALLEAERAREAEVNITASRLLSQLASPNVLLLCLAYFGLSVSLNANAIWTPQIVREFAAHASFASIGYIAAIPAMVTVIVLPFWAAHSDRQKERKWHLAIPLLLAAVGWIIVVWFVPSEIRLAGLVCCSLGSYAAMGIFWTLPSSAAVLARDARPVGIALINSSGLVGSAVSPIVIGIFKDLTGSFTSGLLFASAMLIVAVICASIVATRAARV